MSKLSRGRSTGRRRRRLVSVPSRLGSAPTGRQVFQLRLEFFDLPGQFLGLAQRAGATTSELARLKELERENRELRTANEILRKASAYFAQAELDRRSKP